MFNNINSAGISIIILYIYNECNSIRSLLHIIIDIFAYRATCLQIILGFTLIRLVH